MSRTIALAIFFCHRSRIKIFKIPSLLYIYIYLIISFPKLQKELKAVVEAFFLIAIASRKIVKDAVKATVLLSRQLFTFDLFAFWKHRFPGR